MLTYRTLSFQFPSNGKVDSKLLEPQGISNKPNMVSIPFKRESGFKVRKEVE